jgi:hypothetical protein
LQRAIAQNKGDKPPVASLKEEYEQIVKSLDYRESSQDLIGTRDEERLQLQSLLAVHRRRHRLLELQLATLGDFAPPHIAMAKEDALQEINNIEARLRGW